MGMYTMRTHSGTRRRKPMGALSWARKLWSALDTAVSLSCTILDRYGEYEQLVRKSVSPSDYNSARTFHLDYQAVKALSKYPYLKTGINRRVVATRKFLEAEVSCALTNDRMFDYTNSAILFDDGGRVRRVFHLARKIIVDILGPVPQWEQMDFAFGPGANFGVRGDTSVFKKLVSLIECSSAFTQIIGDFLAEFPGWVPEGTCAVSTVPGSELTFVPKDAKTDRPICIEPLVNGLYQKGVGSYIRNRLLRQGVNLRDQGVNQRLASVAHLMGLSTVDFSSASDTIAYGLVLELLPIDWFEFLDVARSPQYYAEGNWYDFHKFTSMGNAYTFELETLIFYALACASCVESGTPFETAVSLHVYGDDVIIPRKAFDLFLEVSTFAGFTINEEKSYVDGPFFESCGADWYLGTNVRPILLKDKISFLEDQLYVANATLKIASLCQEIGSEEARSVKGSASHRVSRETETRVARLLDLHADCVGSIPRRRRLLVPTDLGDVGLHCDFDVAVPHIRRVTTDNKGRPNGWCGYYVRTWVAKPERESLGLEAAPMSYALYLAGDGSERWWDLSPVTSDGEGYSLRNKCQYVERKTYVWDWESLPIRWSARAISLVAPDPSGGRKH